MDKGLHKGLHKVIAVTPIAESTFTLEIERGGLEFIPGQCVNIGIPNSGVNREYSTYSSANDTTVKFLIRRVEDGLVTPQLADCKPGDLLEVDGSYGKFTLENPEGKKFVFIGSGTGIAPFHCFVKSYPGLDYKIIHGIRYENEAYNREDYESGRYVSCVSREEKGDYQGYVTGYLKENPPTNDHIYYLCGNRNMINDTYDVLRNNDVSGTNIVTEVFF